MTDIQKLANPGQGGASEGYQAAVAAEPASRPVRPESASVGPAGGGGSSAPGTSDTVEIGDHSRVPSMDARESGGPGGERQVGGGDSPPRPEGVSTDPPKAPSPVSREVQYNLIEDLDVIQARVVDSVSDEVIREIPPEERIRQAHRYREFLESSAETRFSFVAGLEGQSLDEEG